MKSTALLLTGWALLSTGCITVHPWQPDSYYQYPAAWHFYELQRGPVLDRAVAGRTFHNCRPPIPRPSSK
jgi:hypothetical protein